MEPLAPTLAALTAQEDALRYPTSFTHDDALQLGCAIARQAANEDRGVAVCIYRESDGSVQFQWLMDTTSERSLGFIAGKRLCAQQCGHSSLWAYAAHEATGAYEELFAGLTNQADMATTPCPSGGAVPIRLADGTWVATIAVSGLHEGRDHELVIRALCEVLGKTYGDEVPEYPGVPR